MASNIEQVNIQTTALEQAFDILKDENVKINQIHTKFNQQLMDIKTDGDSIAKYLSSLHTGKCSCYGEFEWALNNKL
jgi:GTP1/Obg family GTP-binding protein